MNEIKYWKGKHGTIKENQFGTMDNDGYVPDSVTISKFHYDAWVASQPEPELSPDSDIDKLVRYAKKQRWI